MSASPGSPSRFSSAARSSTMSSILSVASSVFSGRVVGGLVLGEGGAGREDQGAGDARQDGGEADRGHEAELSVRTWSAQPSRAGVAGPGRGCIIYSSGEVE